MQRYVLAFFFVMTMSAHGQSSEPYNGPIIDMHLHAYTSETFWKPIPNPATGEMSVENASQHRDRCLEIMKQNKVVLAVVDGESAEAVATWEEVLDDGTIKARRINNPVTDLNVDSFRAAVQNGSIELFGEIGANYAGFSPADSTLDPYYEICEKNDIPVAIHTGGSFPGIHRQVPTFRLRLGDPLLVEDIIVRYPDLRIYLMHAGGHFYERAAFMMVQYPNLYVDIAVLNWVPDANLFLVPFLQRAKEYGVLDRVMFGTDQMIWPEAIEMAIAEIQALDFLSLEDKKGIFYDNAARFLRLDQETIAKHHDL